MAENYYFIKNFDLFMKEIYKINPECNIFENKNQYMFSLNDLLSPVLKNDIDDEINHFVFVSKQTPLCGFNNVEWNKLILSLEKRKILKSFVKQVISTSK